MHVLKEIADILFCVFKHGNFRRYDNDETDKKFHDNQAFKYFLPDIRQLDLSNLILVFSVEGALLRSSSSISGFFPYFMLVAFEAGSLIRASILFAFYPIIRLLDAYNHHDLGLRIMVMICFLGLRQDRFTAIGRGVLPKFLLEDVGLESFNVFRSVGKKIGVTNLPLVMVESFLTEYLEIDLVVGREIKVFRGYFSGILTENKQRLIFDMDDRNKTPEDHVYNNMVGITGSCNGSPQDHHRIFSVCKEMYLVSEEQKRQWQPLSRDMYPRPLIFHDGRLAFRPTFLPMLVAFMWLPIGLFLSILRIALGFFPYGIVLPATAFTGLRLRVFPAPESGSGDDSKGELVQRHRRKLFVCNHRTLLDPVFLSIVLRTPLCAVTYSVSRISEFLSPIKTVRLRRNRNEDAKIMKNILLSQGECLVVCPEGTTCREPYLLRFSPLFAELTTINGGNSNDDNIIIIPVAVDSCVSMFHGTTAGGLKFLDPFFFLMNPYPGYAFELLDSVGSNNNSINTCDDDDDDDLNLTTTPKVKVANMVQREIGRALGFTSTSLTRNDKYHFLVKL